MSAFPKYERYKDSGVEWLGEVPEHWEAEKGKWLFEKMDRPVRPEDDVVTAFRDGQVTLRTNRRTEGFTNAIKEHGYQGIRKGDLVINAMDAFAGAIGVSDSDGKSTPVYAACMPRKPNTVSPEFYAYLLRYMAHSGFITTLAKGIRERSTDFRFNDFGSLELPLPSKPEQDRIVAFLDRKTAEIDTLIAKKQRQIELLDEQKAILIHGAVTRGLNPNAKLKPSGTEWIGDIPEHWEFVPFKARLDYQEGPGIMRADFRENGVPLLRIAGLLSEDDELAGCNYLHPRKVEKVWSHFFIKEGDYILSASTSSSTINIRKAFGRMIGTIPYTGLIRLWPKESGVSMKYVALLIQSHVVQEQLKLERTGVGIAHFGPSHLGRLWIVLPPPMEQEEIQNHIEVASGEFQKVVDSVQSQIRSLQSFRNNLIAHAVTGRIKV